MGLGGAIGVGVKTLGLGPEEPPKTRIKDLKKKLARDTLTDAERALIFPQEAVIPKRTDPEVETARKRAQSLAKRRKGRRAMILTSGRGVTDPLGSVSRPQARAAKLLGGTL